MLIWRGGEEGGGAVGESVGRREMMFWGSML